jgi:antitoxin (DNA-binding transcriptional repressor) of toxin-antitoxin stability system
MVISVTQFKARCLELLRDLEQRGDTIEIARRGRVVARVSPATDVSRTKAPAWERLRGTGRLAATPGESVLRTVDFEAAR